MSLDSTDTFKGLKTLVVERVMTPLGPVVSCRPHLGLFSSPLHPAGSRDLQNFVPKEFQISRVHSTYLPTVVTDLPSFLDPRVILGSLNSFMKRVLSTQNPFSSCLIPYTLRWQDRVRGRGLTMKKFPPFPILLDRDLFRRTLVVTLGIFRVPVPFPFIFPLTKIPKWGVLLVSSVCLEPVRTPK